MIKKFTIYGERNSGTNYLERIILKNFDIELTWEYGWKHFFGFNDLSNSDDTLFICITRDPYSWINSFWNISHHVPDHLKISTQTLLYNEFYSIKKNKKEMSKDHNIYTKKRYKNIFELRNTKNQFLIEDMPKRVKNYILVRFEDFKDDFEGTIEKIRSYGLKIQKRVKNKKLYPINPKQKQVRKKWKELRKQRHISQNEVYNHPDFSAKYEKILNYV
jgi:hypothetical protein